jgi:F-type H+-transporting ATPase subunit epsilon
MDLVVLSQVKKVLEMHDVLSVSFNGVSGMFNILPHHAEMISVLKKGRVAVDMGDGTKFVELETAGAIVHVKDDIVKVLV